MIKTVTLYGIDDDRKHGPPCVVSAQAEECPKSYAYHVAWIDTQPFLGSRIVIDKKSSLISLTPEEALRKYIRQQTRIVQHGRQAAILRADAEKLLADYERDEK